MKIQAIQDDITELEDHYDAIINAANTALDCGSGVDEDIHRAAGVDELHAACMKHPEVEEQIRCPTGQVRVTPAFNMNADHIIHAVGPRWTPGTPGSKLTIVYQNIIKTAEELGCKKIAIPCISTGAHGFSPGLAAQLAITALLQTNSEIEVTLVAMNKENHDALQAHIFAKHANIHRLSHKVSK